MRIIVDLYGVLQVDVDEATGLDGDGVDRSDLLNLIQRGDFSPNDVIDYLTDDVDDVHINQVVEITRGDEVLLKGEAHRLLVVESPSGE